MLNIKCPYNEITLKIALLNVEKKLEDFEVQKRLFAKMKVFLVEDKSQLNARIAKENGITVKELISSPNYKILMEEFSKSLLNNYLKILKEESFTDEEAWAFVTLATGNLKF